MAHVVKQVTTSWTPDRAFAYMADFSHAAEWDPGVAEAKRVDTGTIGLRSTFNLTVLMAGRRIPMTYEITDFASGRVTFTSHSAHLNSVDTVTVVGQGSTTVVTYDARINFRGILRVADFLLQIAFQGVADRAIRGLEVRLAQAP